MSWLEPLPSAAWGALALSVLWLATLLIVAVAVKDFVRLTRRLLAMAGRIERAIVKSETLASVVVERVGRAGSASAKRKAVLVLDRTVSCETPGGVVRLGDGRDATLVAAATGVEVWADRSQLVQETPFEAAYVEASRMKGWQHAWRTLLRGGDGVWLAANVQSDAKGHWIAPLSDGGLVLSTFDPRRFVWSRWLVSLGLIAAFLVVPAIATWLAFQPPFEGPRAIAGGVLGLVYFLLAQPLGVWLRHFVAFPHTGRHNLVWAQPQPH